MEERDRGHRGRWLRRLLLALAVIAAGHALGGTIVLNTDWLRARINRRPQKFQLS